MTGLYFYKLVSPYEEDVTKDCKLTVNEIDHNFLTLKDADINDAVYDEMSNKITLTRNNGDTMELDISSIVDGMTTNLEVDYDSVAGTITITYNDKKAVIDGILTKDNLSKEILTEVISDSSLKGLGTNGKPLGLSLVEYTGTYKPAKRFIDLSKGEFLPKPEHLSKGDRFVTFEHANDYGFLYNFNAVKKIDDDLCHGWRIPSKEDWDNMLNAIEPCDVYKTHSSQLANTLLGKVAGKLLKKRTRWADPTFVDECGCEHKHHDCDCHDDKHHEFDPHEPHHYEPHHGHCQKVEDDDLFEIDEEIKKELARKKINPKGIDKFGMGLLPAGYGDGCRVMAYFNKRGEYWSSSMTGALDVYTKRFDFDKAGVIQNLQSPSNLYSIRLVKDYDGQNFHEVESINGQDYPCVLMPSENSEHGFAIWTAMNIGFPQRKYNPVLPNNGEGLGQGSKHIYYIYAWNGCDFVKKEIGEGESIVLERGLNGECDAEYRLIHGKLVNVNDVVYHEVMKAINPRLEHIEDKLDEHDEKIEKIEIDIEGIKTVQDKTIARLDQEILDRQTGDKELQDQINAEIEAREQADNEIWETLNKEIEDRLAVDKEQWDAINKEIEDRLAVDKDQWDAINAEREARETVEAQIWESLNKEIEDRLAVDKDQWDAINEESKIREEVDNQIWDVLNAEIKRSTERDDAIEEKLDAEIERAIEMDEYLKGRLISKEGSTFDCAEKGMLTLVTDDPENNITIALNGNYGTF